MNQNIVISLFFFLICVSVSANDARQSVGGLKTDDSIIKNLKTSEDSYLFTDEDYEDKFGSDNSSAFVNGSSSDVMSKMDSSKSKTTGYKLPGTFAKSNKLEILSNRERYEKYKSLAKSQFYFSFFKDDFDYTDNRTVFDKTFRNEGSSTEDNSRTSGILLFGMSNYLTEGSLKFGYGSNFGVGYNAGRGFFKGTSIQSNTEFKLWTLPFDITGNAGLNVGYFSIHAYAGPSVLGLIQSRNDRESGSLKKNRRQIGYGYAAGGSLGVNLSSIFPSIAYSMYRDYDVSKMIFGIHVRNTSYSGFPNDDIEISGLSFGLGFTFEYL